MFTISEVKCIIYNANECVIINGYKITHRLHFIELIPRRKRCTMISIGNSKYFLLSL